MAPVCAGLAYFSTTRFRISTPFDQPEEGLRGDAGFHELAARVLSQIDPVVGVVEEPAAGAERSEAGDMPVGHAVDEEVLGTDTALIPVDHSRR